MKRRAREAERGKKGTASTEARNVIGHQRSIDSSSHNVGSLQRRRLRSSPLPRGARGRKLSYDVTATLPKVARYGNEVRLDADRETGVASLLLQKPSSSFTAAVPLRSKR